MFLSFTKQLLLWAIQSKGIMLKKEKVNGEKKKEYMA